MAKDTVQPEFGGAWTQQKLKCLAKYLGAYARIFHVNPRARHFETTYVDAFAGTGYMKAPEVPLLELMPELLQGSRGLSEGQRCACPRGGTWF